jgi:hypothetical protein
LPATRLPAGGNASLNALNRDSLADGGLVSEWGLERKGVEL